MEFGVLLHNSDLFAFGCLQFALDRRLTGLQGRFGHGSKESLYWKQNSKCPVSLVLLS